MKITIERVKKNKGFNPMHSSIKKMKKDKRKALLTLNFKDYHYYKFTIKMLEKLG